MPLVELDVQVPPFRQAGEQVALLELEATVPVQAPPFVAGEAEQCSASTRYEALRKHRRGMIAAEFKECRLCFQANRETGTQPP